MNVSISVKSVLASIFYSIGGISWKLRKETRCNNSVVLMYHRILPKKDVQKGVEAGMYVNPETFEMHLKFLLKFFKILPIRKFSLCLEKTHNNSKEKPYCFLTFDDGWCDFYEHAFPILKAYNIPATVFLPTDFIGTRKWFWSDRLTYLFFQKEKLIKRPKSNRFSNIPLVNQIVGMEGFLEGKLEKSIEKLKVCREEEIEKVLSELSVVWNIDQKPQGKAFISWDEVRILAQSGLISFGSHSTSHRILTTLTDKEIRAELIKSKEKLIIEKVVDPPFITFCYPNGNHNERIRSLLGEAGYSLSVTTKKGWNHPESDHFQLKRISIHQEMTSTEAMFGCRIANIF